MRYKNRTTKPNVFTFFPLSRLRVFFFFGNINEKACKPQIGIKLKLKLKLTQKKPLSTREARVLRLVIDCLLSPTHCRYLLSMENAGTIENNTTLYHNSPRGELWLVKVSCDWWMCVPTWSTDTPLPVTTRHVASYSTKLCHFLCSYHNSSSIYCMKT